MKKSKKGNKKVKAPGGEPPLAPPIISISSHSEHPPHKRDDSESPPSDKRDNEAPPENKKVDVKEPRETGLKSGLEAIVSEYKRGRVMSAEILGSCLEEGCDGVIMRQSGDREYVCTGCKSVFECMSGVN